MGSWSCRFMILNRMHYTDWLKTACIKVFKPADLVEIRDASVEWVRPEVEGYKWGLRTHMSLPVRLPSIIRKPITNIKIQIVLQDAYGDEYTRLKPFDYKLNQDLLDPIFSSKVNTQYNPPEELS